jgi:hypothetical protein
MARIDIRSNGGGGSVAEGVLQLQGGVAMSSTLTAVADQNDTTSPLKLSTTAVQVTSPLRITTSDASGFYLDCEDGSGDNRFSIKRLPAAQDVSLDFASNPVQTDAIVGSIRTYRDGVSLSETMSFLKDGKVGIGTNTPIGILHLKVAAGTTRMVMDGDAGQSKIITYRTAGLQRFGLYVNNTAESGSNAGSDFAVRAYSDAGTLLNTPVFIKRSTGNVGINTLTGTAKLQVVGSGSTSATTSLLVQNSTGTEQLYVRDDNVVGSINSRLDFTKTGVGHRIGNLTITGGDIVSSGGLQFGAASGFAIFASPILSVFFQPETDISFQSFSPNNTTRNGLTFNSAWTNAGAGGTSVGNIMKFNNSLGTSVGNVTLNMCSVTNTVNTTGGTTLQRGFYYNPTLTGTVGFTHRAIQTTSGGAYINTATPAATAALQVDSTTQGFLPPRMTNAERAAITTPAIGLMVYCTDVVEGLYVYKSTGWTFVI